MHVNGSAGSLPSFGSRCCSPLKELLYAPHSAAPSPGYLFSSCSLSAETTESLTIRAGHLLSEPPTVLDNVSLWIFPGRRWEEPFNYTITQGDDVVLSLLLPEIFRIGRTCSHCAVSGVCTSPAVSLCHWCSQLLLQSIVTLALHCQRGSLGHSGSSYSSWIARATYSCVPCRQVGSHPPIPMHSTHSRLHMCSLTYTLTHSLLDF